MFRGRDLDLKYIGMIPTSLELNKLFSLGLKIFKKKTNDKSYSNDVINVKFKQKVNSGKQVIKKLQTKIENLDENKEDYKKKLEDLISLIQEEIDKEKWSEVGYNELRRILYCNGFVYNNTRYVAYKRSSAKSRIGQCLFIKEKLHKPMMKWSRMGLDFKKSKNIDYPSLLAYESLVGSSIENTVKINPKNILVVSDIESIFYQNANVVRTGDDGYLDSFTENALIKNSIFDGESLLDERYFPAEKSMMLLRNHMFKSAAFNCNIQRFLKDMCPKEIPYQQWALSSHFPDVKIFAKDVHLITTPSSIKALKFESMLGSPVQMWKHWKKTIENDGCIFGICKNEKKSKLGYDKHGNVLQQTSYQMLNSLPIQKEDITNLSVYEKEFIENLKNDDDFFISYIFESKNDINCNEMFVDLYNKNNLIVHSKVFRNFRKHTINSHVTHVKNGKIRLKGDYCVMLGNPIEYLYHAIGGLDCDDLKPIALFNNEVYTKMFSQKELTGFRNPHTSPNNVLLAKNTKNEEIDKYFNLTPNIVCVNAIKFPLQDILSGCDYDSDTILLFEDSNLLQVTKNTYGKYNVCLNHVKSSKKQYSVSNEDMAIIDNELSHSQSYIGRTVNTGQLCMSRYWDLIHSHSDAHKETNNTLIKKIDVVTVLSGICIDLAKKMFDIDINREIDHISQAKELLKEKPMFWKYVSKNTDIKSRPYKCPMDFLFEDMSNLDYADRRKDISFQNFLIKKSMSKSLRKQEEKIFSYVENMVSKINNTYATCVHEAERDRRVNDIIKYYTFYVGKLSINEFTMFSILTKITKYKKNKITARLLKVLHETHKTVFLNAFFDKNDTL